MVDANMSVEFLSKIRETERKCQEKLKQTEQEKQNAIAEAEKKSVLKVRDAEIKAIEEAETILKGVKTRISQYDEEINSKFDEEQKIMQTKAKKIKTKAIDFILSEIF